MPLIHVTHLQKRFRVAKSDGGPVGALRRVVTREQRQTREVAAVEDISFAIAAGEMVAYVCLLYTSPSPRDS